MDKLMRHNCNKQDGKQGWSYCATCNGRIHLDGCTARKNKKLDCCEARHEMLYNTGQSRGIADDSMVMWCPSFPGGCHKNDISPAERDKYYWRSV